jgi:hypothetical protein
MKQLINSIALVVTFSCILYGQTSKGQAPSSSQLREKLQKHLDNHVIEKVHLHLDKPYYMNGDDIWFKSYVLDDNKGTPSLTSGILNVDLVGPNNVPIKHLKLSLLNGVAWGNIKLPENIPAGKYMIFAYTQWMRNNNPDFFFTKELSINGPNKSSVAKALEQHDVDVQFLPEGGALVEGLPCKLAFKAVNHNGFGEHIQGTVYDNDGTEIVRFESSYLGMGQLLITPIPGKTYIAKIRLKNNTEKTFRLPGAKPSGHVLNVNASDSAKIIAKVFTSADLLGNNELNVIAHHNGRVYFESKVSLNKQISIIPFATKDLPSGIIEITLLDDKNIPICERIVFTNNGTKHIDIDVDQLKPTYGKRSHLVVDARTLVKQSPVQGSFSVAVTNTSLVAPNQENETHILSSLLLTSDLIGFVEKPNSYFTNNGQLNRERIDYLMLTQGWRKIAINGIANDKALPAKFGVENHLSIKGIVTKEGKGLPYTKISMISTPNITFSKDTVTDENGRFLFDHLAFEDSTNFVLQVAGSKNDKVKILLDTGENFIPQATYAYSGISSDSTQEISTEKAFALKSADTEQKKMPRNDAAQGSQLKGTNTLNEVEIIRKVDKAPNSSNFNGPGMADAVFSEKDLENSVSLMHYLEGRVPGMQAYQGKYFLSRQQPGFIIPSELRPDTAKPMDIYLDGTRLDSMLLDDIIAIGDIESVEILKSIPYTALYGASAHGVILITSKTGRANVSKNYAPTPGLVTISPHGFHVSKEFYSPKYDVNSGNTADYRATVFWEPNLITDKEGKANINYFNTDIPGMYRIVIEGIDADGNLGRKVLTYEVK